MTMTRDGTRCLAQKSPFSLRRTVPESPIERSCATCEKWDVLIVTTLSKSGLPIFPLRTSPSPRDTHFSWAGKAMFTTKKGNIGTPVQMEGISATEWPPKTQSPASSIRFRSDPLLLGALAIRRSVNSLGSKGQATSKLLRSMVCDGLSQTDSFIWMPQKKMNTHIHG